MSAALKLTVADADDRLAAALTALPGSLGITREFSPEVLADADAASRSPQLPDLGARQGASGGWVQLAGGLGDRA